MEACVCRPVTCKCPANPNYVRAVALKQSLKETLELRQRTITKQREDRESQEAEQAVKACEKAAKEGKSWIFLFGDQYPDFLELMKNKYFIKLKPSTASEVQHYSNTHTGDWKIYRFTVLTD